MLEQDKILNFLGVTGPTLPSRVAKNINTTIIIASAHLSDLSSQGKVKISHLKVGGSPLYYLPGQEEQLDKFAAGNTNPKNLQVLNMLKEKKVLREANLELLAKVALRSLKDFAVPLNVNIQGKTELFWKWHLLPAEETNQAIRNMLTGHLPSQPEGQEAVQAPQVKETNIEELETKPIPENEQPEPVETSPEQKTEESAQKSPQPELEEDKSKPVKEEKVKQPEIETEKEPDQTVSEVKPLEKEDKLSEQASEIEYSEKELVNEASKPEKKVKEKELKPKRRIGREIPEPKEKQKKLVEKPNSKVKKHLLQKLKDKVKRKRRSSIPESFIPEIEMFLKELEINIEQKDAVRKNKEIDLIVTIPSAVGEVKYFCKAKSKSRCDEKDLSAAYMEAQVKKLPLLFLYTNEINKKAQEMLESGAFENVIVRKIEKNGS